VDGQTGIGTDAGYARIIELDVIAGPVAAGSATNRRDGGMKRILRLAELSGICGYEVSNCNNYCKHCNPCSYPGQKRIDVDGWEDPEGCPSHSECMPNRCPVAVPVYCTGCLDEDGCGDGCDGDCWREDGAVDDWDVEMILRKTLEV